VVDRQVPAVTPRRQRPVDRFVDPTGSERACEHHDDGPVDRQGERPAGRGDVPIGRDREDLLPHRVAGDDGPREIGPGERHSARSGEAGDEPVRGTGPGVLVGDDERNPPQHRCNRDRSAGEAAERQHHRRPTACDEEERTHPGDGETPERREVAERQPPLDATPRQSGQREPGLRHQAGLDAPFGAHEVDHRGIVTAGDELPGDGDSRQDVARGPTSGDDHPAAPRRCR